MLNIHVIYECDPYSKHRSLNCVPRKYDLLLILLVKRQVPSTFFTKLICRRSSHINLFFFPDTVAGNSDMCIRNECMNLVSQ